MHRFKRHFSWILFLLWVPPFFSACAPHSFAENSEPPLSSGWPITGDGQSDVLVGWIAHVEGGNLLRYVPENKDWVATVKDAPLGLEDVLYAENGVRAECIMPNRTWIRIGGNTQMQMITLNPGTTTVDVAAGLTRMYNKNRDALIQATTPFGYVVASEGSVFDLYVGDESLEVVAVRGSVDFIHETTGNRYTVREKDGSLIADSRNAVGGSGTVDAAWDDWNGQRDALWARRLSNQDQTAEYLPEPIRDAAYTLEENGQWEQVYYEGEYHAMWRPTSVNPGWRPFSEGRWTVYYGDNCWVPAEPFGYVTHHYGSWIWIDTFNLWYWMPPVARMTAASSRWLVGSGWYPGRVGWLHNRFAIGWFPLTPHENYYSHRLWGRRVVVVGQNQRVNLNLSRYRHIDHAVIIPSDQLYRGNRYAASARRLDRTAIINNYQSAATINNTVIRTYDTDNRRFAFNDVTVERKPHAIALNRISDNRRLVQNTANGNGQRILRNFDSTTATALPTTATVRAPMTSNRTVADSKVNQPVRSGSFAGNTMKPENRQRQSDNSPEQMAGRDAERQISSPRSTPTREQTSSSRSYNTPRPSSASSYSSSGSSRPYSSPSYSNSSGASSSYSSPRPSSASSYSSSGSSKSYSSSDSSDAPKSYGSSGSSGSSFRQSGSPGRGRR